MKFLTSLISIVCVSLLLVGCSCHSKHGHHHDHHGVGKMHHEHGDK